MALPADFEGLTAKYQTLGLEIVKSAAARRVLVVTHIDADGLCSGSVVFASLMRKGVNVAVRTVPELDAGTIASLASQRYDLYIFTDLASSLISELESALGGRYLVIDHHQVAEDDMKRPSVVNAWAYGYDGGAEACSSSMAYFFALALDPRNTDLSPLAVIGALADRQDRGHERSLIGLNKAAADDAGAAGLLTVSKDLLFTGRETRPIHESVALTSTPYLRGLTGSKDSVLALLHQSGLPLKEGGSWRTISSLTPEEKMKLTEVLASVVGASAGASDAISALVGDVFTLEPEDSFTPLRDAREFGTLLNSCGRMGASGTGIAICLGDRGAALKDALKTLGEYRLALNKALDALANSGDRIERHGKVVFARGEGIVEERLLGPVISILTSSPGFKDSVVVGSAASGESEIKISAREGDAFAGEVNLGLLMREAAESVGGTGGGHSMAAGAKIPASAADRFYAAVAGRVGA